MRFGGKFARRAPSLPDRSASTSTWSSRKRNGLKSASTNACPSYRSSGGIRLRWCRAQRHVVQRFCIRLARPLMPGERLIAGLTSWSPRVGRPLIPAVVDAVSPTPVVAAGGIADGRGLAAALALGAAGAWIGTRFLASEEAAIHPRYRELLLKATENDTVFTEELFDIRWPKAPHRVLRNKTVDAWEAAGRPPSGKRPGEGEVIASSRASGPIVRYQSYTPGADAEGDIDALSLWAGQSVGLVSKLLPAGDIVREIADEAQSTLRRLVA